MGKRHPRRPEELVGGRPFRGTWAISEGFLTKGQLRGPAWRRLCLDVYVDARAPVDHLLRCRAVGLVLPPTGALTGRSAACVEGVPLGDNRAPVSVIVPPDVRFRHRGCTVRRAFLPATHVRPGNPPVLPRRTIPQRTAWEIAREPDLLNAVAAVDVLLRHRYLRDGAMDSWTARYPRSRAAKTLALVDGRAESVPESHVRVRVILEGFPRPVPQHEIWIGGTFVARVDLAWPDARVAVEYDGAYHAEYGQFTRDRARLNRLVDAGWTVLHLTAPDLQEPLLWDTFTSHLRGALAV